MSFAIFLPVVLRPALFPLPALGRPVGGEPPDATGLKEDARESTADFIAGCDPEGDDERTLLGAGDVTIGEVFDARRCASIVRVKAGKTGLLVAGRTLCSEGSRGDFVSSETTTLLNHGCARSSSERGRFSGSS